MDPSTFVAFFHDALNAYNKMCEPILQEFDIPPIPIPAPVNLCAITAKVLRYEPYVPPSRSVNSGTLKRIWFLFMWISW